MYGRTVNVPYLTLPYLTTDSLYSLPAVLYTYILCAGAALAPIAQSDSKVTSLYVLTVPRSAWLNCYILRYCTMDFLHRTFNGRSFLLLYLTPHLCEPSHWVTEPSYCTCIYYTSHLHHTPTRGAFMLL